jgi:hypothetical protein
MKKLLLFIFLSTLAFSQLPPTPNLGLTNPAPHAEYSHDWYNNFATIDNLFTNINASCGLDNLSAVNWNATTKRFGCVPVSANAVSLNPSGPQTILNGFPLNLTGNLTFTTPGTDQFIINNGTAQSSIQFVDNGNLRLHSPGGELALAIPANCALPPPFDGVGCVLMNHINMPTIFSQGPIAKHDGGAIWPGNNGSGFVQVEAPDAVSGAKYISWPAASGIVCLTTTCGTGGTPGGSNTQVQFNDSGAFGGDSGFLYNKTTDQASIGYSATSKGPWVDPMAPPYNCVGDGVADDTTCFQAAVAAQLANGGCVLGGSGRKYLVDRIQISNFTCITGVTGSSGELSTEIIAKTDAAFVSATPNTYLLGVTFTHLNFRVAKTNAIDIPFINQLTMEDIEVFDPSGCGVVLVDGERWVMHRITGHQTSQNGFAVLCTGDASKSLFSGSITNNASQGPQRAEITDLYEFGTLPSGFSTQWLWWAGNGTTGNGGGIIHDSTVRNMHIGFSGSAGVLQTKECLNSNFNVIDLDHVAQGLSAAPFGINIGNADTFCRIQHYNPAFNTNNITTQLYIESCNWCSLDSSHLSTTVNNSTTFAIKFGAHSGFNGSITNTEGGLFIPTAGSNQQQEINLSGDFLSPNNSVAGAQLVDMTNTGAQVTLGSSGNATPATGPFSVKRGVGDVTSWTTDLTSNGTALTINELLNLPALAAGQSVCTDVSSNLTTTGCAGGGSGSAFNALTSGTNTTAVMTVGTGATLQTSGTGAINATGVLTDKGGQVFNVLAYGSPTTPQDCATDAIAGINAAITAAGNNGTVYLPRPSGGCYALKSSTLAMNGTHVNFQCEAGTILQAQSGFGSGGQMITIGTSASDILITGCVFDGNSIAGDAIDLQGTRITVDLNEIKNMTAASIITPNSLPVTSPNPTFTVTRNHIHNGAGTGLFVAGGVILKANDNRLVNVGSTSGQPALDCVGCSYWEAQRNQFINSGHSEGCLYSFGVDKVNHSYNYFSGCPSAIHNDTIGGGTISNNYSENSVGALPDIWAEASSYTDMSNNTSLNDPVSGVWNGTTNNWGPANLRTLIESFNATTGSVASANVALTSDSGDFQAPSTASLVATTNSSFTTGTLFYKPLTPFNIIHGWTDIWIKSVTNVTLKGDLQFVYSQSATCATADIVVPIPVLPINSWYHLVTYMPGWEAGQAEAQATLKSFCINFTTSHPSWVVKFDDLEEDAVGVGGKLVGNKVINSQSIGVGWEAQQGIVVSNNYVENPGGLGGWRAYQGMGSTNAEFTNNKSFHAVLLPGASDGTFLRVDATPGASNVIESGSDTNAGSRYVFIGGGAAAINTSGAGVPTAGWCITGSTGIYIRTDSDATHTLYVCDSSTHTWTPK